MLKSGLVILLTVLVALVSLPVSTAQAQCARDGEYCQNHWDCCSNSCMSFSAKCVRSLQPAQSRPVVIAPAPVAAPILANRGEFDSDDVIVSIPTPNRATCAANGGYCQNHWDCCSNSCLSFSHVCVQSNQSPQNGVPVLINRGDFYEVSENTGGPKITLEELVDKVFGSGVDGNNLDGSRPSDAQPDCKQIGEKCYRHEECCTMRCHGYLHQCVT